MKAQVIRLARPTMTDAELLEALALPAPDVGPDSLLLAHGETIRDRIPHKIAKGRAMAAQASREAFRIVRCEG